MSKLQVEVCSAILNENFGSFCCSVAICLLERGRLPINSIKSYTKLNIKTIKQSLFSLIHHGIIKWSVDRNEAGSKTFYSFCLDNVLIRLAYPMFYGLLLRVMGEDVANVFLQICKHGKFLYNSDCSHMNQLLSLKYVQFSSQSVFENNNLVDEENVAAKMAKRSKTVKEQTPEFLMINKAAFVDSLWKSKLAKQASDERLQECLSFCLDLNTPLVHESQLSSALPHLKPIGPLLKALSLECPFFSSLSTSTGYAHQLNLVKAKDEMRLDLVRSFILECFGLESARIFMIIRSKGLLEEKTISKLAMMSPKDTRERLFVLLKEGILHLQEVPRTIDHAPSRTFFLWSIKINMMSANFANRSLKIIHKLMVRAEHERLQNKNLLLKSKRTDVVENPSLLSVEERRQLILLQSKLDILAISQSRIMQDYLVFAL